MLMFHDSSALLAHQYKKAACGVEVSARKLLEYETPFQAI